jgi:hypothetical protein
MHMSTERFREEKKDADPVRGERKEGQNDSHSGCMSSQVRVDAPCQMIFWPQIQETLMRTAGLRCGSWKWAAHDAQM